MSDCTIIVGSVNIWGKQAKILENFIEFEIHSYENK